MKAASERTVDRRDLPAFQTAAHRRGHRRDQPAIPDATDHCYHGEGLAERNDPVSAREHTEEYSYYPSEWVSPYIDRRRKVGWDMYALLGLTRENKAGMAAQHGRNYRFFDAPVGLIFTVDSVMEQGSWLDYGMFLENIMVAARGRGLDTCAQAAFCQYHRIIKEHIGAGGSEMMVCGMSLGHADPGEIVNSLETVREPVSDFARFLD